MCKILWEKYLHSHVCSSLGNLSFHFNKITIYLILRNVITDFINLLTINFEIFGAKRAYKLYYGVFL